MADRADIKIAMDDVAADFVLKASPQMKATVYRLLRLDGMTDEKAQQIRAAMMDKTP